MKKKLFSIIALMCLIVTGAWADASFALTKAEGAEEHGTITFKVGDATVTTAAEGDVVTVIVTPNTGYVVNQPSGQWYAAVATAPRRTSDIDLLNAVTLTPVEGVDNTWTFTMKRANVEISATYKKLVQNAWIADISALTYTSEAQEPTVTVKDGTTELTKDTHYTVAYSNNTNAGTATVTITGIGDNYTGTASKTFTINKAALTVTAEDKTVTYGDAAPTYTATYNGFVGEETTAVLGGTLAFGCPYVQNTSGVGDYTITPSGLTSSNYEITFTNGTLTVGKKALESSMIGAIADVMTYTGNAFTPEPAVTFNGMTLVKGTDFAYSYENNVNAGLATATENAPTVTITAAENCNYSGSAQKTFTINKAALSVTAENKSVIFGDDAPEYTVTYDGFVNNETKDVLGGTLAFACDYVKNQSGAGEYDITPSGLTSDNYAITFVKGTLTVSKKELEAGFIADIADLIYNGVAQKPAPVVTFNGLTLVASTDYMVNYKNNVNVGTATVTITAPYSSKKYTGSVSKTFSITKKALTVTADDKTVSFGDDAPEYTVTYDGFVNNETEAVLSGKLSIYCLYEKNKRGSSEYVISPSGLTSNNYAISYVNGKLTVGKKELENTMIADIEDLTYNGLVQKPEPVVTFNGMTLKVNTDYTVAYADNKNAGTATMTITAKGSFVGTVTKTFTIKKKALTVTAEDKSITFGDAAPRYTATYEGFVNKESKIVLAGELKLTCDYVKNQSGAGEYDITPSGLTSNNYDIIFTNGKLTVEQKALESGFLDKIDTQTYTGQPLEPALVLTFNGITLVEGTDYTAAYADNINAGTATVTITGKGNFKGELTAQFTIVADATAIDTVQVKSNGQWYDMNGRKLQNKPTKKGLYILNGKKTIIK